MLTAKKFTAHTCTQALVAACSLMLAAAFTAAHAGFTISGTRVIYEEDLGETTVHVRHSSGDVPTLMQVWLDDGDPKSRPGQQDLPFILSPAVAYMAPGNEQAIRVLRTGQLPLEQETLLFFNVLEIPPEASDKTAQSGSFVRFAAQARLKFFYRPRGLQPAVGKAPDRLRFVVQARADGKLTLRISNPTPYHITFADVSLQASRADSAPALAKLDSSAERGAMISPHGELTVTLKPADSSQPTLNAYTHVRYTTINDLGGKNTKLGKLDPS